MRYAGQGWEIPVPLPDQSFAAGDAGAISGAFRERYADFFGRAIDGLDGLEIEVVTWSVRVQDEPPAPARHDLLRDGTVHGGPVRETASTRCVFDPARGAFLPTGIIERAVLAPGAKVLGPAIIVERETSTVVTAPFDAVVQGDGSLLLVRKAARPEIANP